MKRVVVGLSGGVDSSVAAYLLKEQGYDVIGLFMKNWHDESVIIANECPWIEDSNDAMLVAQSLGIPYQVIDLSAEYKERIVDYMFDEYAAGRTPNPDVLCNREIKFDTFLKTALSLGADYVATGHYCQKEEIEVDGKKVYRLLAGKDKNKDQSYFLCQVTQEQLSKALFPIGHLDKSEVRRIAKEQGLVTANKKDSQGLCFVGKISLPDFLQQQLKPKEGEIIEIPADTVLTVNGNGDAEALTESHHFTAAQGEVVGNHRGAHYFTIGQRKGLQVGGKEKPLFVIGTDVVENLIYTGQGDDHPGLYRKGLRVKDSEIHWIRRDLAMKAGETRSYMVRIRYRQALVDAELRYDGNTLFVLFADAQRGVAPGQFVAWYEGEELIGSGVIE
ncbi:tRNA 2-thiouridine(34) synthase MnmA [Cryomorpha ignava]|uniref:tRNA-specific 2-thiouridylase MnmA n=1 Tax=Cryomorpha ignava TaxID=101383 RepID=A0A7K3WNK0_9FLAO|nr:tRNA 2-thiouridine(34) synthase MnmA [Cryomorpha ignava]NEN23227.1 tRNA 2-thiouridine(34) synthase MnmA [Cryomorpha ignava]